MKAHRNELLISLLLCLVFFSAGFLNLFPFPTVTSGQPFPGYYTLVVKYTPSMVSMVHRLEEQPRIKAVVAYETALASFTDFDGLESVPLSTISSRFDPVDPFFNGLFIFLLFLLHRRISYKLLLLAGVLCWVVTSFAESVIYFMLYMTISFYWAFFLIEFIPFCEQYIRYKWLDKRNKTIVLQGVILGSFIFIYLFVKMYSGQAIWDILISTGMSVMLLLVYTGILWGGTVLRRRPGFGHVLFTPVSITRGFKRRWFSPHRRVSVMISLCALYILAPLLFFITGRQGNVRVPIPITDHHKEINLESLREAVHGKQTSMLPDLSDYIRHIAFQTRLAFGSLEYSFPKEDEKIELSVFNKSSADRRIKKSEHILETFDKHWCDKVLADIPRISIEHILLEQGGLVRVTLQKPKILGFNARQLWTIILLWCIFLCPLLLFNYYFTPRKLYGLGIPLTVKNKEH
ncbi:MAG: hypothetical protein P8107_00475 [Spirochaetia bacterium]